MGFASLYPSYPLLRADKFGKIGYLADEAKKMSDILTRITINPDRMHGRPCIRDLRITVADILNLLSVGQSREEILREYPYLESADIDAVLAFAARQADHPVIAAE
jgi:uncharacterized protein (DUF433 family)